MYIRNIRMFFLKKNWFFLSLLIFLTIVIVLAPLFFGGRMSFFSKASTDQIKLKMKIQGNYTDGKTVPVNISLYDYEKKIKDYVVSVTKKSGSNVFDADLDVGDVDLTKKYAFLVKPKKGVAKLLCSLDKSGNSCTEPTITLQKSYVYSLEFDTILLGDVPTQNGTVNGQDLSVIKGKIGQVEGDNDADLNQDGIVDTEDFSLALYSLGKNAADDSVSWLGKITPTPTVTPTVSPTASPTTAPTNTPVTTPTVSVPSITVTTNPTITPSLSPSPVSCSQINNIPQCTGSSLGCIWWESCNVCASQQTYFEDACPNNSRKCVDYTGTQCSRSRYCESYYNGNTLSCRARCYGMNSQYCGYNYNECRWNGSSCQPIPTPTPTTTINCRAYDHNSDYCPSTQCDYLRCGHCVNKPAVGTESTNCPACNTLTTQYSCDQHGAYSYDYSDYWCAWYTTCSKCSYRGVNPCP